MLFDSNGVIRRYETAEDILRDFFELRMAYYGKRRLALIQVSLFRSPQHLLFEFNLKESLTSLEALVSGKSCSFPLPTDEKQVRGLGARLTRPLS